MPEQTLRETLIEQYEAGDIGPVEFTELALELDLTMDEIGKILEAGQEMF